jgi:hypothetical protein
MVTLSLEELATTDKNVIKLPSIHEQRQRNMSRQGMLKDSKDVKALKGRVD